MTSSAQTPEPTDLDYERAADVVTVLYGDGVLSYDQQDLAYEVVARAIAVAVAGEREKYLRVADELDEDASEGHGGEVDGMYEAARRIREVSR